MKKTILYLLVACCALFITSCDYNTENQTQTNESSSAEFEQSEEKLGDFNKNATLAETVMYEENGVKITAKGLTYTNYSADVELLIENNSGKDLTFVSGSVGYSCNSVNGYMVEDGYLNCDVANGKSANDSISFNFNTLMLYGINEIADLEIEFDISDDDYNHTYSGPIQLKTSVYDSHDYSIDNYQESIASSASMNTYNYSMVHFSTDSIYEESGVKYLSTALMRNEDGEYGLFMELENTSTQTVYVSVSDIGINGLTVYSSTWTGSSINPGKRCIIDIDMSSVINSDFQEVYGINEIASVSLSLTQSDTDGNEIVDETPIEIIIPNVESNLDLTGNEVYNNNGLTIVSKTILPDSSDDSSDIYVLMLAKNNSGKMLSVDDEYDSLSVNGIMTDYIFDSLDINDGGSAAIIIELDSSSLKNNSIMSVSDISDIEFTIEIEDENQTIDTPTISIQY